MKKLSAKTLKERYAGRMEQTAGARALSDDELDAVAGGRDFDLNEMVDWYSITSFDVPDGWDSAKLDSVYLQWFDHIDALPDGSPTETFSRWMAQNYPGVKIYYD